VLCARGDGVLLLVIWDVWDFGMEEGNAPGEEKKNCWNKTKHCE